MSDPMTNRKWVTLLYFFTRQSGMPWPIVCEWDCQAVSSIMSHDPWPTQQVSDTVLFFGKGQSHAMTNSMWVTLSGSFINYVSSHDKQAAVSYTALFPGHSPIMSHPMTTTASEWDYFISLPCSLIPWPTGCKWDCFISCQTVPSYDQ